MADGVQPQIGRNESHTERALMIADVFMLGKCIPQGLCVQAIELGMGFG